ncbi:MAG: right-handed parallel beta-helix repeat-containing protein [Phycisphaerales bacterium]
MRSLWICVSLLCAAAPAGAGDLAPPGAPAPSMKTLDQVEPRIPIGPLTAPGDADSVFRITQPGSYFLTGDLLGEAGKRGVEIAASGVTLDLMGFTMQGVAGSLEGVGAPGSFGDFEGVRVRNGFIREWGGSGVDLNFVIGSAVEDIVAMANDHGIVLGVSGVAIDCHVESNVREGVRNSFGGARATRVQARSNGGIGISLANDGVVEDCFVAGSGSIGVNLFNGGRVSNTVSNFNGNHGINIGSGTAIGCAAEVNGGSGINAGSTVVVDSCSATSNDGDGVTGGGVVISTVASFNDLSGLTTSFGATVRDCTFNFNSGPGITVTTQSTVAGNTVRANGNGSAFAPGILVTGNDNRIDDNQIVGNDVGLDVDGVSNIIMRNTAAGNGTSYQIVANNFYGRIVDMTVAATPAVNGNSAANQIGTTEPWSNFAY